MAVNPLEDEGATLVGIINGQPNGKTLTVEQLATVQQAFAQDYVTSEELAAGLATVSNDAPVFDPADYATSAQGDLADTAVQPADIADFVPSSAIADFVASDTAQAGGGSAVANIVTITRAAYDGITPDPSTVYLFED